MNKRQENILELLRKKGPLPVREIVTAFSPISRITISRDIAFLLNQKWVSKKGDRRSAVYFLAPKYSLFKKIDSSAYFLKEYSNRKAKSTFTFDIFEAIGQPLSPNEIKEFKKLADIYQKNLKILPKSIYKKEFERLIIEFSWKSSQIEGNTYSLLETEALILSQKEAKGHKREEAIMILNHKKALDYIRHETDFFKEIDLKKIEEIHSILIDQLNVEKGLRQHPVGITGTLYKPLDNIFQIREAMENLCEIVNKEDSPYAKALLVNILIAYIQPFVDGNKRTSRMIGNAILLAHDCCPLSYRSADEQEYKKAVVLFYEQNNLMYFKELFMEQAEFAVQNYFVA